MKGKICLLVPGVLSHHAKEHIQKSWKKLFPDEEVLIFEDGIRPITIEEPLTKLETFALGALQGMTSEFIKNPVKPKEFETRVSNYIQWAFAFGKGMIEESEKHQ